MLKAMCRKPPCMNIEVRMVRYQGIASSGRGAGIDERFSSCSAAASRYPEVPSQTTAGSACVAETASAPSAQSSPG
jgi:hypothetical protein